MNEELEKLEYLDKKTQQIKNRVADLLEKTNKIYDELQILPEMMKGLKEIHRNIISMAKLFEKEE